MSTIDESQSQSSNPSRIRRYIERMCRLTLFWIAWCVSFFVYIGFLTWTFLDASLSYALWVVHARLFLDETETIPGLLELVFRWDSLGSRVFLLTVLSGILLVATLTMLMGLFRKNILIKVRVCRGIALATLAFLFVSAGVAYPTIRWTATKWRVIEESSDLKSFGRQLAMDWPREHRNVPGVGRLLVKPDDPNTLYLSVAETTPRYSTHTTYRTNGSRIERHNRGKWIFFELNGGENCAAIYVVKGNLPQSFRDTHGDPHTVVKVAGLGDGWFLVKTD